ncbi:hypothetical protein ACVWXO_002967 [Bradyrhizobium sp. LM2.7]
MAARRSPIKRTHVGLAPGALSNMRPGGMNTGTGRIIPQRFGEADPGRSPASPFFKLRSSFEWREPGTARGTYSNRAGLSSFRRPAASGLAMCGGGRGRRRFAPGALARLPLCKVWKCPSNPLNPWTIRATLRDPSGFVLLGE